MDDKNLAFSGKEKQMEGGAPLINMHRGLDDEASQAVNARLILLLCNHIGGHEVLLEAMRLARAGTAEALAEAA